MARVQSTGNPKTQSRARVVAYERPERWKQPLDPEMLDRDLSWLMEHAPFHRLNPAAFNAVGSLEQILRYDSRILRFDAGDVIVREGDYGSSAFIVLRGSVQAFLVALWEKSQRNVSGPGPLLWETFRNWFRSNRKGKSSADVAEGVIDPAAGSKDSRSNRRDTAKVLGANRPNWEPVQNIAKEDGRNRIFLQDIDAVLKGFQSESIEAGSLFGEMAAITRTPHRFTVVADSPVVVLEIRWQGLRLLRRDPNFREYLDSRYRVSGLQRHLRETPLFRFLEEESADQVVLRTKLESYGEMEWFADYKESAQSAVSLRIEREPLIAEEGKPAEDLFLIRAGFARVSYRHGNGHQTQAYLGRGQMFGLEELTYRFLNPASKPYPYQSSLRALGFVDVLRIPAEVVLTSVLPQVRKSELPRWIQQPRYDTHGLVVPEVYQLEAYESVNASLIEFLVDERIMNGQKTMVIDLDRCTGCDECVKACAKTHQGTPRFIRNGPQFGPLMFPHACMHCVDPVCMIGCPTGAIGRNADTGVISIQESTCIGCKTCAESCPYTNIVMLDIPRDSTVPEHESSEALPVLQASKCDLCQNFSTGPACQQACPHQALFRINTSDVFSISQLTSGRKA